MSQQLDALAITNEIRFAMAAVRAEVTGGALTVAQALTDARAERMQIGRLLCAQPHWGPTKAHRLLGKLQIWPTRHVRDLTARQKAAIVEALER